MDRNLVVQAERSWAVTGYGRIWAVAGGITKKMQTNLQQPISLEDLPPMVAGRKGQLRENWGMHNLNWLFVHSFDMGWLAELALDLSNFFAM